MKRELAKTVLLLGAAAIIVLGLVALLENAALRH